MNLPPLPELPKKYGRYEFQVVQWGDELTQDALRSCLHYDPETGVFLWKERIGIKCSIGKPAGRLNSTGYTRIGINGVRYLAHRLVWLYVYGEWPKGPIDHINGVRNDNRLSNLRDATPAINSTNVTKPASNNKSTGLRGVSVSRFGGYEAHFNRRYVGKFPTPEEAHAAYTRARLAHLESLLAAKDAAAIRNGVIREGEGN